MNIFVKLICFLLLIMQIHNTKVKKYIQVDPYRLPGIIIPTHYDIHLILESDTFQSLVFSGLEEITFDIAANQSTHTIQLHSKDLRIVNVALKRGDEVISVNEPPFYSNRETDFLMIYSDIPLSGTGYTLLISFYGYFNKKEMKGFYFSSYEDNGEKKYFAATHLEAIHARQLFPCFDEPKYKAYFNLTISHPTKYTAISNTVTYNTSQPSPEQDIITVKFKRTPKMSTYLLAIVVSELSCDRGYDIINNISLEICSRNEMEDMTIFAEEITPILLQKLEKVTKFMYAEAGIGKLTEIALPQFKSSAMENWGLITFRETSLLCNKNETSNRYKQIVTILITHELTHQWFGNIVTLEWWSNAFLNEGLATYFQYHIIDETYPDWELQKQFVIEIVQEAFLGDVSIGTPVLTAPVSTPEEIKEKFGPITYKKGGSIFRMLANSMAENQFHKGLQSYINKFQYGNTNPENLWECLGAYAAYARLPGNKTLKEVMHHWINRAGFPLLTVKLHDKSIVIGQERFLSSGHDSTKWYVPISYTLSTDKNKFKDTRPRFWLIPEKDLNIYDALDNADWIILNNQQTGYYRVNYDDALWHKISTALNQENFSEIDVISRSQIVDDLLNLAKIEKINYTKVFDIISFLKNDTEYYPWFSAMKGFSDILGKITKNNVEAPFKNYILKLMEKLYKSVSFDKGDNDNHVYGLKQELVIKYACRLNLPDCVQKSNEIFVNYKKNFTRPNANIRQTVYCTVLRHSENSDSDWNSLWNEFKQTKNPTEYTILLNSLGCTQNKEHLKTFLTEIITPHSSVKVQDAITAFGSVAKKSYIAANAAFDIVKKNLTQIEFYLGSENVKFFIDAPVRRFTTQKQIDDLNDFIQNGDLKREIKGAARNSLHTAQYDNLEWGKKFENQVKEYFSSATSATFNNLVLTIFVLFIQIQMY